MPADTSNRDMGNLIRAKRRALNEYMFQAPDAGPPTDAPLPADLVDLKNGSIAPGEDTPTDAVGQLGADTTETNAVVVKAPGEKDDPDMFTYEPGPDGGWMVYPPGTPCPSDSYKCQLDHPATSEDFTAMEEALDAAGGLSPAADVANEPPDEGRDQARTQGGY